MRSIEMSGPRFALLVRITHNRLLQEKQSLGCYICLSRVITAMISEQEVRLFKNSHADLRRSVEKITVLTQITRNSFFERWASEMSFRILALRQRSACGDIEYFL